MALNNTRIAVYWKDKKGNSHRKVYNDLSGAEQARNWLIKQGLSVGDIELAIVKETINEPEPIAQ